MIIWIPEIQVPIFSGPLFIAVELKLKHAICVATVLYYTLQKHTLKNNRTCVKI
jgi:hypothetical protein